MLTSDDLSHRLAKADRDHQGQLGLAFFWRAAKYLAAVLLALFALDVTLQLGARSRAALAAAFGLGVVAVAVRMFYVARVRRNSLEKTARLLEARDASLGSKLINFLQLRGGLVDRSALTRQLGEMALADYSTRLAGMNFEPLTRAPELKQNRQRAAWVLAAIALVLAGFYPISTLECLRFADPFGDHPPYSFTRLEITEPPANGAAVTYNQGVVVKVRTAGHQPDELYLSFYDPATPTQVRTVPMYSKGDLGFLQEIEGVKSDLLVFAHTKNQQSISKKRLVRVALTPKVEKAFVTVSAPAYTGLKPTEVAFDFKEVKALVGSEVKFRVQSNRPLSAGSIELQTEDAPPQPVELRSSAENEVAGTFAASESGRMKFSLVDVARNVSLPNLSAALTVTHDQPPAIDIENPPNDSFVCEDFKVEAKINATDDYGLKTIRIHRALNEVFSAPRTVAYDKIATNATEIETFDLKDLGVQPGDTISFFAEAVDTCPDPHLARSKTVHLMVISTDQYNDDLRERSDISDTEGKYSELLNEFHDLVDEQKDISEQIKSLQEKLAHGGDQKNLQTQLDKLLARQSELNKKLADMADRMDKFVRAKPLYDLESDLQETLTQKAAEIRDSLKQNNETLKNAAEKSASDQPTQEHRLQALASLQEQSDKQLARLDQTQKDAEEKVLPPLKDAEKMNAIINDMNRFKMLHDVQSAAVEQTLALTHSNPTETDRLALKQLAGTEKEMAQALQQVIADLRTHAKDAREAFPKAAESARDLALAMDSAGLSQLADNTAFTMLAGSAAASYQSADKLRQEMEKLFANGEPPGMGGMCQEMDKYLRLKHSITARNTFQQMSKCRKFGFGSGGTGSGVQGQGGLDGYAASMGENFGMLGGETFTGQPNHSGTGGHGQAANAGPGQRTSVDTTDVRNGVQTANRATDNVQTENPVEGYHNVIDAYFNTITK